MDINLFNIQLKKESIRMKYWGVNLIFISILLASCLTVYGQQVGNVVAANAHTPPVIDGRVNDSAWQNVDWHEGFTVLGSNEKASPDTRFALLADQKTIYFAAYLSEPMLDQVKARCTRNDDENLFTDDCVEIFLSPGKQRQKFYQLIVNSLGAVTDIEYEQAGVVSRIGWGCHPRVATSKQEDAWVLEMAIPLAELDIDFDEPLAWAFNITRERRAGSEKQLSSFVKLTGSFLQPAEFATLQLTDVTLNNLNWDMSYPNDCVVRQIDGQLQMSCQVTLKNKTGSVWPIELASTLTHGGTQQATSGKKLVDILDAGQVQTYQLQIPMEQSGSHKLYLKIVDPRSNFVYCGRTFGLDLAYKPLSFTFTCPEYRNAIYATQSVNELTGSIHCMLLEKQLTGATIAISLKTNSENDLVLAGTRIENVTNQMAFQLPIPQLHTGTYQLEMSLCDANGKQIANATEVLRKLPPVPSGHEWRIENKILLKDGKPFLPLGFFSIEPEEMKSHDGIFNVTLTYAGVSKLDKIHAVGGYCITSPYNPPQVWGTANSSEPLSDKDAQQIIKRVDLLKNHPALLGWYLADEPEYHNTLPLRLQQVRELIARIDPIHPTIIVNHRLDAIQTYSEGTDIYSPDPYPTFKRNDDSIRPINIVQNSVHAAVRACGPGQMAWVTPQAFNSEDFKNKGARAPTFLESRNMAWQAVIAGAKGIMWWSYAYMANYPDCTIGIPHIASEIKMLEPYVLGAGLPGISIVNDSTENFAISRRKVEGVEAIFAVNTSTQTRTVKFMAPSLAGLKLYVLGEQRIIHVSTAGDFTDQFTGLATHLYLTKNLKSNLPGLADIQEEIDGVNASRKHQGNLAFEDSGVQVTASSIGAWKPSPQRVVDGLRGGMSWQSGKFPKSEWIELEWPKPQKIGKLVIYTESLADIQIQIPKTDSEQWQTITEMTDTNVNPVHITFPQQIQSDKLRLYITRLRDGFNHAGIWEIEAYE
jgi:hypothetical protein